MCTRAMEGEGKRFLPGMLGIFDLSGVINKEFCSGLCVSRFLG